MNIQQNEIIQISFLFWQFSQDCYNDDHVLLVRASLIKEMVLNNLPLQETLGPVDPNDAVEEMSGFTINTEGTSKRKEKKKKKQQKIRFSFKVPRPKGEASAPDTASKPESVPSTSVPLNKPSGEDSTQADVQSTAEGNEEDASQNKEDANKGVDAKSEEDAAKRDDVASQDGVTQEDAAKNDHIAKNDHVASQDDAAKKGGTVQSEGGT